MRLQHSLRGELNFWEITSITMVEPFSELQSMQEFMDLLNPKDSSFHLFSESFEGSRNIRLHQNLKNNPEKKVGGIIASECSKFFKI